MTQKEAETQGFSESKLGHLGLQLPIGVPAGNPPALEKAFAFRPFRMKEEREIDKIRSRKGGAGNHPGKVVLEVMAYMLTEWGGDPSFSTKSHKHRTSTLRHAFMADVLYAYTMLRVESLGPILAVPIECPACDHKWKWQSDLEQLEVPVVERFEQLTNHRYTLGTPITIGENQYDTLELAPPTWAAVADISPSVRRGGVGDIKARMIKSCVREFRSSENSKAPPVSVGTHILDEMTKRDVEGLALTISETFPDVDLSMEIECPSCSNVHTHSVQWNWDFFFSSSSLPTPSRT